MLQPPRLTLAFCFLIPSTLLAQTGVYTFHGPPGVHLFANSHANVGDLDQDGFDDIAAGAPYALQNLGQVTVFSGRTGAVLFQATGDSQLDHLGWSVRGAGDVDGDGINDVVAGAPGYPAGGANGALRVFSGADGSEIHTVVGVNPGDSLGFSVAGVGDLDQDGYAEFAGGATQNSPVPFGTGYAAVYSGVDGSLKYKFFELTVGAEFGASITSADFDGDNVPDIVVGSHLGQFGAASGRGSVRAYSGATAKRLWSSFSESGGDHYGAEVTAIDDVDGDGVREVLVGAFHLWSFKKGTATVVSGATGKKLYFIRGNGQSGVFGRNLANLGDLDNDGVGDFAVTDAGAMFQGQPIGAVRVYSGRTGSVLHTFRGMPGGGFGASLGAIDLNRDGTPELSIGSPQHANRRGRLEILSLTSVATIGAGCGERATKLAASTPRVGLPMAFAVTGAGPGQMGFVIASDRRGLPVPLTLDCTAYLDPASAVLLQIVNTDATGAWSNSQNVPAIPSLAGTQIALQAVIAPTNGPLGLDLTNGVSATIQN